jgi:hypothetical protein
MVPRKQYEFLMHTILGERNLRYKALASYLLWGTPGFLDEAQLLPCHFLANLFGWKNASNVNTTTLLDHFRRDVLAGIPGARLELDQHDWLERRCRSVREFHLGILEEELGSIRSTKRMASQESDGDANPLVFLHDGSPVSRRRITALKQKSQAAGERAAASAHPASRMVIETMASVPEAVFARRVTACFSEALEAVARIENPSARRAQENILRKIDVDPKPVYFPSGKGNTHRVFSRGHIPDLKREIRKIFTLPWPEADLRCSQLAIAARLWEMPRTTEFLASGYSVWEELLGLFPDDLGTLRQNVKACLKKALYALLYLKNSGKVQQDLQSDLDLIGLGVLAQKVMSHWLFSEINSFRRRQEKLLLKGGGLADAFGAIHHATDDRSPSSVISQVNQSYELYALWPVLEWVNQRDPSGALTVDPNEMRLVLWAHDGFSIACRRKDRVFSYQKKLSALVGARLNELGIMTTLEWATDGDVTKTL